MAKKKRKMAPAQKRKNIVNLAKARKVVAKNRRERARFKAEERIAQGSITRTFISQEAIEEREKPSEIAEFFVFVVKSFEETIREHEGRGGGHPEDIKYKEAQYHRISEILLSFRHIV